MIDPWKRAKTAPEVTHAGIAFHRFRLPRKAPRNMISSQKAGTRPNSSNRKPGLNSSRKRLSSASSLEAPLKPERMPARESATSDPPTASAMAARRAEGRTPEEGKACGKVPLAPAHTNAGSAKLTKGSGPAISQVGRPLRSTAPPQNMSPEMANSVMPSPGWRGPTACLSAQNCGPSPFEDIPVTENGQRRRAARGPTCPRDLTPGRGSSIGFAGQTLFSEGLEALVEKALCILPPDGRLFSGPLEGIARGHE